MEGLLLEYETEMFLSLFSTDGLLIAAEGLGIDRILLHFMKIYSEEGSLVLLLNTTTPEQVTVQQTKPRMGLKLTEILTCGVMLTLQEFFTEQLRAEGVNHLPQTINSDIQSTERYHVYTQGGVLFVTSRILVVDFLTDRIPAHLISGNVYQRLIRP